MDENQNHSRELQFRDQLFSARQYSYEQVQKLTYFIITAELVVCGYIMLNAENLLGVKSLNCLFLLSGLAAMIGILWRFFYNITHYNNTHGIEGFFQPIAIKCKKIFYYLFLALTAVTFLGFLISGYFYLSNLILEK